MVKLITENMDIWTAAQTPKTNGGRGRGNNSNSLSIHGMKKLRELILELAVRGRLVPQDPNDEPASVLLERIAKEKTRLLKEGKIKKQKPLQEIDENEKPFELPKGWEWTRFGALPFDASTGIDRGKSFQNQNFKYPYFKMNNILNEGGFDLTDITRVDASLIEIKKYSLENGDFLFNTRNSRELVGKTCVIRGLGNEHVLYNNNILRVKLPYLYPEFVDYWFRSTSGKALLEEKKSSTTNVCAIYQGKLFEIICAIPPLDEQHRIVEYVDELMTLCDRLEQQQTDSNETHQALVETLLSTLSQAADQTDFTESWQRIADHFDTLFTTESSIDQLKQTILQLAVRGKLVPQDPKDEPASVLLDKITKEKALLIKKGEIKKQKPLPAIEDDEDVFKLPKGWALVRLGDITNKIGSGSTPRGGKSAYVEIGIPFLRSQNIWNDRLELKEVAYIPEETHQKMSNTVVFPKDILLNITGASLGRCTIYPDGLGEANVSQHVTIIRPTDVRTRFFLHTCILSPYGQNLIWGRQVGMAREGLSKKVLELFEIPVPPLSEQHRIVAKVDELLAFCDDLQNRLQDAQTTQVQLADAIVEQAVA